MSQTVAIKQVSLRQFSRAVGRYLKQCPIQVVDSHGIVYDIFLSDRNVSDKADLSDNLPVAIKTMTTNSKTHKFLDITKINKHSCGCTMKESKLCKEHGRF